jgi:hypothetical protein
MGLWGRIRCLRVVDALLFRWLTYGVQAYDQSRCQRARRGKASTQNALWAGCLARCNRGRRTGNLRWMKWPVDGA